jgi:uncharacterized protein YxeA
MLLVAKYSLRIHHYLKTKCKKKQVVAMEEKKPQPDEKP